MTNTWTPRTWTDVDDVPSGTIVVGWDGSPHAEAALAWALARARAERRPLTVAHAVPPKVAGEGPVWADQEMLEATTAEVVLAAGPHVRAQGEGLEVGVVVAAGEPRHLLPGLSRRAAMLVVGSHGRGPVRSKLLGSVGVTAVREASCPTVVVRPHATDVVRRGILAAVDFDDTALSVTGFGFHEASVLGLPLTVVHSVPEDGSVAMVANARRRLSETVAGLQERYPDVHCTLVVQRGTTDEVLRDQAEGHRLTVIGAPRRTRRHLTTTASRLVERSTDPIAVVPLLGHGDAEAAEAAQQAGSRS
jgi:nucleotide-binding universal stress UspA family protein